MPRHLVLALALMTLTSMTPSAMQVPPTPDPVRYVVRFPEPQSHVIVVEADIPTDGRPELELMMPVWTPGSYLVREYARNVAAFRAAGADGRALDVTKSRKNRWRIAGITGPSIRVTYEVYCREMSVRTNWVESGFAFLNGAPTFMTVADRHNRPHEVHLELPAGWPTSVTALAPSPDGKAHHYRAPNYDTIVDSPIVAGNPVLHPFTVSGRSVTLVNEGEASVWDGPRSARDAEAIVRAAERFWGSLPFERYVILNLITEGAGGLEHRDSTALMTNRWRTRSRNDYLGWLGLLGHEFFHTWNGKRLRPRELGPFDYENEVYTQSLWVYQGFTEYYDNVLVHRAGLSSEDELLDAMSTVIRALQTTPGRAAQTASEASYDAWIRYYRPDENSPNVSISYYTKGGVIGFLLDIRIRQATGDRKSLDDVMRLAYSRYASEAGYTTEQFRAVVNEVAGTNLSEWLDDAAGTTRELRYDEALSWLGLRFRRPSPAPAEPKTSLGVTTRVDGGRLLVSQVRRGTPGFAAGLDVDDEILAIDDYRVRSDTLANRLEKYRPGEQVTLLVSRRDLLTRVPLTLAAEASEAWRLEVDPQSTPEQLEHRRSWLSGQFTPE